MNSDNFIKRKGRRIMKMWKVSARIDISGARRKKKKLQQSIESKIIHGWGADVKEMTRDGREIAKRRDIATKSVILADVSNYHRDCQRRRRRLAPLCSDDDNTLSQIGLQNVLAKELACNRGESRLYNCCANNCCECNSNGVSIARENDDVTIFGQDERNVLFLVGFDRRICNVVFPSNFEHVVKQFVYLFRLWWNNLQFLSKTYNSLNPWKFMYRDNYASLKATLINFE